MNCKLIAGLAPLILSGSGIYANTDSVVVDNTANNNGASGIYVNDGVTVRGNAANGNPHEGIYAGTNTVVVDNTANHNDIGISVKGGVTVRGNVATNNVEGLGCNGISGYADNVFASNSSADLAPSCVNLGQNLCDKAVCP